MENREKTTLESMGIKRVIVTGSEGYIGRALVPKLIEKGYEVKGIDALLFQQSSWGSPYKHVLVKDIRKVTEDDLQGVDAVIHLAALSNDPMGHVDEEVTMDINYRATVRLAKLAKLAGIRRFIFSSSCSVYGKSDQSLVDEVSEVNPLTAYARSKVMAEKALADYADSSFCVVLLRNATVYGYSSNFRTDLVVNNLVYQGILTNRIELTSDGKPWRPLIDVRDLASFFCESLAADAPAINGKILNSGFNENNYRIKDIVEFVKVCFPGCFISFSSDISDERSYRVSFDRIQKVLPGVRQEWPIIRSVEDMVAEYHSGNIRTTEKDVYTRLHILTSLLAKRQVDSRLFWNTAPGVSPHIATV